MSTESEINTLNEGKKFPEAIFWGGVLVWAGLIFGAEYFEWLPEIGNASGWSWIFLGAGIYGIVLSVYRLGTDHFTSPSLWDWIWAGIFLIIGAAGFISVSVPWWLFLIIIGAAILGSAFIRRE